MGNSSFNNKYIGKIILITIIVIINIIAIIGVISSVGGAIKQLKVDIASGKISAEKSLDGQSSEAKQENEDEISKSSYDDSEEDMQIDFKRLFKVVISDKNVRKSFILMVFALVLLACAIFVLYKLK